ncbi:MAG: YfhO family protein, partial [Clostridia bacterium]|nr:YfhO family protein [Clostridia bacterium]
VGSANTIAGLDRRGALEKLLGVNYYLAKEGEIVPIGFDVIKSVYVSDEGESYNLWTRSNKADMMYAFDYVVDYDTYNNNDAYGKQELVMNAVVLEGDDLDSVNMPQYLSENNKNEDVVNYEIVEKEGLTIDDKKIEVYSNNAYLTIKTNDEINNSELLVLIDNIVNYNMDVSAFIVDISAFNENDEWISGRSLNIWTTRDHMYKGQDSWLFNLGAINQPTYKIRISFNTPGMYSYDGIKIFAEPLEKEYNLMNQLTLCVDGDILVDNNKVKAKVNLEDDSIVFVSIPYMEGWKAKIDGKETKVYKADEAFIALKVPAGVHEVEMEYKTRFIEISIIAGILLWIYILGLCVKKRREQKI